MWSPFFTNVAARTALTSGRSARSIAVSARAASTCSLIDTGRPAARSSTMNSPRRLRKALSSDQLLGRLFEVGLVLEQDVKGRDRVGFANLFATEQHERAGPVERL